MPEKPAGETQSLEPSSPAVSELNPFLARILARVTENERKSALGDCPGAHPPSRSGLRTLAEWHVKRAACDPRSGDAADSLVAIAIVLHELADLLDDELLHQDAA